jgi:hypothetical protein
MWLHNWGWQKLKWKDPKTSNDETQVHGDVNGVGVKDEVAHDKTNAQWELRGFMKHDKLRDMGHLVSMIKKEVC